MINIINDAFFLEDNGKSIYKIYLFIIRICLMLMIYFKFKIERWERLFYLKTYWWLKYISKVYSKINEMMEYILLMLESPNLSIFLKLIFLKSNNYFIFPYFPKISTWIKHSDTCHLELLSSSQECNITKAPVKRL